MKLVTLDLMFSIYFETFLMHNKRLVGSFHSYFQPFSGHDIRPENGQQQPIR